MREYRILYKQIDPTDVSDLVAVGNKDYGNRQIKTGSYTYGSRSLKAVRNPAVCKPNTGTFFDQLEESILKEGFRNPIFCVVTDEGMFSVYGMSRLWLGKHHKMSMPCIIADYTDTVDGELLETKEDVASKFKEIPKHIQLENHYMEIWGCKHSHMGEFDGDTNR